jgi:hypothetical protein
MRIMTAAVLSLCVSCGATSPPVRSAPSPDAEQRAVLAVVQQLFAAMRTKDTSAFRDAFEPNARLVGIRVRPPGDTVVQLLTWERFRDIMLNDTRGEWIERAFTPEVRIRGTLATVWAEYDFHFGPKLSHCGVDALQLLKTTRGWKIVSIADTYEPVGCVAR